MHAVQLSSPFKSRNLYLALLTETVGLTVPVGLIEFVGAGEGNVVCVGSKPVKCLLILLGEKLFALQAESKKAEIVTNPAEKISFFIFDKLIY